MGSYSRRRLNHRRRLRFQQIRHFLLRLPPIHCYQPRFQQIRCCLRYCRHLLQHRSRRTHHFLRGRYRRRPCQRRHLSGPARRCPPRLRLSRPLTRNFRCWRRQPDPNDRTKRPFGRLRRIRRLRISPRMLPTLKQKWHK